MLSIAEIESRVSADITVQSLARKYFKLTTPPVVDKDKKLWYGRVRAVLDSMSKGISETTYECEPKQSFWHGKCTKEMLAVNIFNIHLCPAWWTLAPDARAYVLLHEWAHHYGPSVNQIFETYCGTEEFLKLSASELVAEPDAYASYIFELVTGSPPPATVC